MSRLSDFAQRSQTIAHHGLLLCMQVIFLNLKKYKDDMVVRKTSAGILFRAATVNCRGYAEQYDLWMGEDKEREE